MPGTCSVPDRPSTRKGDHMVSLISRICRSARQGLTSLSQEKKACHPLFGVMQMIPYARLDRQQHVYLDYTGGGLYAECQLRDYFQLINHQVLGNPHSTNPASQTMNTLVERARRYVLDCF